MNRADVGRSMLRPYKKREADGEVNSPLHRAKPSLGDRERQELRAYPHPPMFFVRM